MELIYHDKLYKIIRYFKDSDGYEVSIISNCSGNYIVTYSGLTMFNANNSRNAIEENFKEAYEKVSKKYNLTPISDKEKILEYFEKENKKLVTKNKMNCSENWYNPFYAIYKTFTKEEIESMSDNDINNLFRLVTNVQEALY